MTTAGEPRRSCGRILFVDDEEPARKIFAKSLSQQGFEVDVADGGDEALGMVKQHPYAVVATDLRMPRLDGLDLISQLRPRLPDATYLVVTGAPAELSDDPERSSRVDGVIAKPWTIDALASAIERAVALHRRRKSNRSESPSGTKTNRILLVEDNPGDALLVNKLLSKTVGTSYEIVHAERLSEALELLEDGRFKVALVDLSLPDARGLDTIKQLQAVAAKLPIVVLSGFDDEPLAVQAVQAGAQDYLVKGETGGRFLHRCIRYAIERKQAEDRLAHLAHHDQLTGLANRTLFHERVSRAISQASRSKRSLAALFLDLDRFKTVNDSMGHEVGDLLLERVAQRLIHCVRQIDTIARLGGDEFAILLEEIDDENHAPAVAQRILDALGRPFHIRGHEVTISASIGVSFFPDNGESTSQLLRAADSAMYRAKESGRNAYQFFSEETHSRMMERIRLENELRRALVRRELTLFYQPQLDLKTGRLAGVEALLRWQHPEMGFVPPGVFIPLLEDTGLIIEVGEWALRRAMAQASRWRREGYSELRVAVNLSARQFEDEKLVATVERAILDSGGEYRQLELEITESLLLQDTDRTVQTLERLKELGIRITIDDFGTGYSSLEYLKTFPIDALKIDRSFVKDITEDADDACIAAAIIALAHNLRLEVIAEGVETNDQLRLLGECDGIQGFLLAPPRPEEEISLVLAQFGDKEFSAFLA